MWGMKLDLKISNRTYLLSDNIKKAMGAVYEVEIGIEKYGIISAHRTGPTSAAFHTDYFELVKPTVSKTNC